MRFREHLDVKLRAICDTDPSAADCSIDFYLSYVGHSQAWIERMFKDVTRLTSQVCRWVR